MLALGMVVGLLIAARCTLNVGAGEDSLAVGILELEQRFCAEFIDGIDRVKVRLAFLPREADDNALVAVISKDLVVGDARADHTNLDDGLRGVDHLVGHRVDLILGRFISRARLVGGGSARAAFRIQVGLKGSLYTAADINAPPDIVETLNDGLLDITIIVLHAHKG